MLCVVSHDAGGAEILASYVARNRIACEFVLDGPGLTVFQRRLGRVKPICLNAALDKCDEFLTGTSWQSNLEWKALVGARELGKKTISFLDHWGNYRERFIRNKVECLPDTFYVGDVLAEKLTRQMFPRKPVFLISNPHFDDVREAFSKLENCSGTKLKDGLRVLFVCEPLTEHGGLQYGDERHWGYTEFEALRYFFEKRESLGSPVIKLVIRPHPSESKQKYREIAHEFGKIAFIGGKKTLLQEIAECDVVVGCESMAMVIGLIAGRRVVSAIPPGGRPCSLPQSEIESLAAL